MDFMVIGKTSGRGGLGARSMELREEELVLRRRKGMGAGPLTPE